MNEWALFYLWASIIILFWGMSQYTPRKKIFLPKSNLFSFSSGIIEGSMGGFNKNEMGT